MVSSVPNQASVDTSGVVRRLLATALDAVPTVTLWWATTLTLASSEYENLPPSRWNLLDRIVDIVNTAPGLVIWPLMWCGLASVLWHAITVALFGTSPGKKVVGLRVIAADGKRPGPLRALLHALLRPLTSASLAIGPLWAFADPERRTLYDRMCGIYVTITPPTLTPSNRRR